MRGEDPRPAETEARTRIDAARQPALRLREVEVSYGPRWAVRGVSLEVAMGERVGLLGESGCGKSSLLLASLGLLAQGGSCRGAVELGGRRVEALSEKGWRKIRGPEVGVVFQQPSRALHPLRRAGAQVVDVLRAHGRGSRRACRQRARELFAELDLDADLFDAYPHQMSGGQQQRVCLARALAPEPGLLLADEPTASLDRATEASVLELVDGLARSRGLALLWVSHDPAVLARVARRICVMYAGQIVERGSASEVLEDARHPYTRALLACRIPTSPNPAVAGPGDAEPRDAGPEDAGPEDAGPEDAGPEDAGPEDAGKETWSLSAETALSERLLPTLVGEPPSAMERFAGCPFEARCPARRELGLERCAEEPPPWRSFGSGRGREPDHDHDHGRGHRCWLDPEDLRR